MSIPVTSKAAVIIALATSAAAQSPQNAVQANGAMNYQNLHVWRSAVQPTNASEAKAFKVFDAIADSAGAIVLAWSVHTPQAKADFAKQFHNPQEIANTVDLANTFYETTKAILHNGTTGMSNEDIANYVAVAKELGEAVPYSGMSGNVIRQNYNTKEDVVISNVLRLVDDGVYALNNDSAKPGNEAAVRNEYRRRSVGAILDHKIYRDRSGKSRSKSPRDFQLGTGCD